MRWLIALLLFASPAFAQTAKPLTVIELFTSQGCSSCPPADALLGALADRPDVLPLSLHVDYWNYLGWKDPHSARWISDRQRAYASVLKSRSVYTPMIVVDGLDHAVGSDRAALNALLARARKETPVTLALRRDGARNLLDLSGAGTPAALLLATYSPSATTEVPRGENAGRTLTNRNVVRSLAPLARWDGRAATLPLTLPPAAPDERHALILQAEGQGRILGALTVE
jgi:hypothetical protein